MGPSQTTKLQKKKELFQQLDQNKSGSISYSDLRSILNPSLKIKKYFDYIYLNHFQCGGNQLIKVSFDDFLEIIDELDGFSKQSSQKQMSSINIQSVPSRQDSTTSTVNFYMNPVNEKEFNDVQSIVEKMLTNSKNAQTEQQFSIAKAVGLKQRDSFDTVTRPDHYDTLNNPDYLTETELCVLIDKYAATGVSLESLLTGQTLQRSQQYIEEGLKAGQQKDKLIARLIVKEFDTTHSGALNKLEHGRLMGAINRELKAHKAFVGADLKQVGQYITGRTLGFGATSICKCAVNRDLLISPNDALQNQVALKICLIKPQSIGAAQLQQLDEKYCKSASETAVLSLVKHDNVVEMFDSFDHKDHSGQNWHVIALTLCGGSSLAEYRSATNITEPMARYIFYQVILGLNAIHQAGYAHMDLRLENILIDNEGNIRLADFGNALEFQNRVDQVKCGTICGTISHMSPEMLIQEQDFSAKACDMWAAGLILYELLTGRPAFNIKDGDKSAISKIMTGTYASIGIDFSQDARELCDDLLSHDYMERPSCVDVMNHPWLQKEMHKPAIAKGILLLDPAPNRLIAESKIVNILQGEQLIVVSQDVEKDKKYIFKLKCNDIGSHLVVMVTAEYVDQNEPSDPIKLNQEAKQTLAAQQRIENIGISKFKHCQDAIKLTFYMRQGILWEFQKMFRRVRYLIMNVFSITGDVNERLDNHPTIEQILHRSQSEFNENQINDDEPLVSVFCIDEEDEATD